MKQTINKVFSLLVVLLLVFIVTGCTLAPTEDDNNLQDLTEVELSNEIVDKKEPSDDTLPIDDNQIVKPSPGDDFWSGPVKDEKQIVHKVTTLKSHSSLSNTDYSENIVHIQTYEEYLKYEFSVLKKDKEFFENYSLIIYDRWEGSGSNHLSITNLTLNKYNELIINLKKVIPQIGTCDMVYWHFTIEYVKTEEPVSKILIRSELLKNR